MKKLGKKKQRLYNKAKRSKIASDFTAFKACRAEYRKLLKKARQDYYIDFLEPKIDKHSRYLFNHIKKLKKDSVGIEALKLDGKIVTDPNEKAEALAREYEFLLRKTLMIFL